MGEKVVYIRGKKEEEEKKKEIASPYSSNRLDIFHLIYKLDSTSKQIFQPDYINKELANIIFFFQCKISD